MSAILEYQKLAYRTLKLVHPNDVAGSPDIILNLGHFRIIESDAALDAVIRLYLSKVRAIAEEVEKKFATAFQRLPKTHAGDYKSFVEREDALKAERRNFIGETAKKTCLTFQDFNKFADAGDAELKNWDFEEITSIDLVRLLARQKLALLQKTMGFPSNRKGYQDYLRIVVGDLFKHLSVNLPAMLPEKPRRTHSYIMSTTETGKSELLKAICLNYIQDPDYAGLVVLDPGGDMVPEMARWPELIPTARLVYIDPLLDPESSPVINPFDAEHLDNNDRALLTEQIVSAIGSLVEGKVGGTISVNMEAVLYPSVRLLVDLPNTNLRDLQRLMKNDKRLVELGCNSPRPEVAEFFKTEFNKLATLVTSKQSITVKIGNILSKGTLEKVICGRTSIDLERLMAERKVILVNLAKGRLGASESSALGTLLVSLIQSICMKRALLDKSVRPMTHLIIDECQNFVTGNIKTIIRETRKFGLAVTLAQQEVGAEMAPDLARTVTRTTNVKIAGRSAIEETRRTGALVGVKPEAITPLEAGQFFYKNGTAPTFLLRVRSDRVDNRGGVNASTWHKIQAQQIRHFYRSPDKRLGQENEQRPVKKAVKMEEKNDKPQSNTGYDFE